jgi:hypothetical protein
MTFVYVERNAQGDIITVSASPQGQGRPERLPEDDAEVVAFLNPVRPPERRGTSPVALFNALKAKGLLTDADYDAELP